MRFSKTSRYLRLQIFLSREGKIVYLYLKNNWNSNFTKLSTAQAKILTTSQTKNAQARRTSSFGIFTIQRLILLASGTRPPTIKIYSKIKNRKHTFRNKTKLERCNFCDTLAEICTHFLSFPWQFSDAIWKKQTHFEPWVTIIYNQANIAIIKNSIKFLTFKYI